MPCLPVSVPAGVGEIRPALNELKAAQQAGDFAKQGQALAALDAAVAKFQSPGTPGSAS